MTATIGTDARGPAIFEHEAMFYTGSEDFVRGVGGFVREGLIAGEAVVVALPSVRLRLLQDFLGEDGAGIEFLDMEQVGANPARIIGRWHQVVDRLTRAGREVRGVGEPAWPGRSDIELFECQLHELLLNDAFQDGVPWRLLCPYDANGLPTEVLDRVKHAHPTVWDGHTPSPSAGYRARGADELFSAELSPVPADAVRTSYRTPAEVAAARNAVRAFAQQAGLVEEQAEGLMLAAGELASNSIRHADGRGELAMWHEPDCVVIQLSDDGHITDPLVGRRAPLPTAAGGRGIYLAYQLCDLVQLRSAATGTTVRVRAWTDARSC